MYAIRSYYGAERERTAHLPAPLSRALSYIAARFNEPLQLADVAEEARVSPAYLSRIFGEYLSVSFVEYITELVITSYSIHYTKLYDLRRG